MLNEYLVANDLLPRYQSAYTGRSIQLRDTASPTRHVAWPFLFPVDILTAADRRKVTLLGLLDLSAAFDCVDHDILLQRLSFLSSRTLFLGEFSHSWPIGRNKSHSTVSYTSSSRLSYATPGPLRR